jgi:protein phosphatase
MGTTLVLLALSDGGAWCAWVGDSRAYRWRDGQIEQITRDDTVVRELLDQGVIDESQVAAHPERSVLSQALGTKPSLRRLNIAGPIEFTIGDRFLLCSDGLHDVVPDVVLAEALAGTSARAIADALLQRAIASRADDNISCVVIGIDALPVGTPRPRATAALVRDPP